MFVIAFGRDVVDVLTPGLDLFGEFAEGIAFGVGKVVGGSRGCVQDAFLQWRDKLFGSLHQCGELGVVVDVFDEHFVSLLVSDRVLEYVGDAVIKI